MFKSFPKLGLVVLFVLALAAVSLGFAEPNDGGSGGGGGYWQGLEILNPLSLY